MPSSNEADTTTHKEGSKQSNTDRLLTHLKDDSLAHRLVRAYQAPEAGDPTAAMKEVLADRLKAIRGELDGTEA